MKIILFIILILNYTDYFLTINNLGNFEEANFLMKFILDKPVLLAFIKLFIVPCLIVWLWFKLKNPKLFHYILVTSVLVVYIYAVIMGILIALN